VTHPTGNDVTRPLAVLAWLTGHLEIWLAKWWLVAALAAGFAALAVAIVAGNPWIATIVVVAFVAMGALGRTLSREDGAVAWGLVGWALAFRLLVVLILSLVSAEYATGGLLSPDGTGYLAGSRVLVQSGFEVGPPFTFFGTYDIGQYFVFAAAMKALGSEFLVLAVFNATVGALAAPLAFAWARLAVPRHAVLVGGIAALSPSLALLSTTNLLKDPMVILATLVVALSVAKTLRAGTEVRGVWFWLGLGAIALTFLHMTRFYVAAYLELGLIVVVVIRLLWTRGRPPQPAHLLGLIGAILVAEILAGSLGWPSSPAMVSSQIQHVSNTEAMQPALEQDDSGNRVPGLATAVDVARRMFGPYVWVPPKTLDLKYLVLADFDLYADTFLWYVILPFLVVGVARALASLSGFRDEPTRLGYLAIFVCVYLAQYLAINLSYRQREDVFLLALAFVPTGARWMLSRRPGQALYASYWVVILFIAAGQIIRSRV
jgi:hypothetical protein